MQPHVRPEQPRHRRDHLRTLRELPEYRVHQIGLFDAAHARTLGGVRRLQIVNVGMFGDASCLCDQIGDYCFHPISSLAIEQILDQQVTVLTVKRDIFVGNHLD
jgi:hypothetical protein